MYNLLETYSDVYGARPTTTRWLLTLMCSQENAFPKILTLGPSSPSKHCMLFSRLTHTTQKARTSGSSWGQPERLRKKHLQPEDSEEPLCSPHVMPLDGIGLMWWLGMVHCVGAVSDPLKDPGLEIVTVNVYEPYRPWKMFIEMSMGHSLLQPDDYQPWYVWMVLH